MPIDLEAEYNPIAATPDFPQILERWRQASAEAYAARPAKKDIAYGRDKLQKLDFFPAPGQNTPILVFFHGGGWQRLDKSDYAFLVPSFLDARISVALVNYPLAPATPLEQIIKSSSAAVAWIARNARKFDGDPESMIFAGHSAGAHLAAMAATGHTASGLVCVGGAYDLEPVRGLAMNQALQLTSDNVITTSPARLHPARVDLPVILAVGERDSGAFHAQQDGLAATWRAAAALELEGRNHFTAVEALGDPDHPLFGMVLDLLDGRLPAP